MKLVLLSSKIHFEKCKDEQYKEIEYWKCICKLILANPVSGGSIQKEIKGRFMKSKESSIDSLIKENFEYAKLFIMKLYSGFESESVNLDIKEDV